VTAGSLGETLFSAEQIAGRIRELGEAISRDYTGRDLVLVGILRGAAFFLVDLARTLSIPVTIDFIAISSYGPSSKAAGVVRIIKDLEEEIAGRDLLVVEDIVDTGLTLGYLLRILRERGPASLQVCTLLDRSVRRIVDHPIAYRGFEIPDTFVVGYGLDYQQKYRNLPFIAVLKPAG
jgi:hypoxanthine phosphoribosyltransferase